jgi:predicted DsbA family dithiol-disulfide isomerase
VAFPLHPEIPEEGITYEELFAGRAYDIEEASRRVRQWAATLGLPLSERGRIYNTRLAQELAKWAESKGKGNEFHDAVFRAYYVDRKNIGKSDELVNLAESIHLPAKEARHVLQSRKFREAVDADWARSRRLEITAVPTFVIGEQRVVGFQPLAMLEAFLKSCGVRKRQQ